MTYTDHVHADVVQLTALLVASAHKHCADDFFNFVFITRVTRTLLFVWMYSCRIILVISVFVLHMIHLSQNWKLNAAVYCRSNTAELWTITAYNDCNKTMALCQPWHFVPTLYPPFSCDRQHLSYDGCLEVRGEIIRTVLCCIVY